jgi:hypothetical protein
MACCVGVHQCEACGDHTAHRVSENLSPTDTKRLEERLCVVCQLVQGELVCWRLGGFAKSDLVWHDDTVAPGGQATSAILPSCAAEVLSMEKHNGVVFPRGTIRGRNVHVGHGEFQSLRCDIVVLDGPWVRIIPCTRWYHSCSRRYRRVKCDKNFREQHL